MLVGGTQARGCGDGTHARIPHFTGRMRLVQLQPWSSCGRVLADTLDTLDAPAPALPPRGTQRRPLPAFDAVQPLSST